MFRRRKARDADPFAVVDPATVPPRFAADVRGALAARARYRDVLAGVRPGPVHERLTALGQRLDDGVLAVWDAARRAGEVERVVALLEPDRVTAEYKAARRAGAEGDLEDALAQRFDSVQRLMNSLDDTEARLRLLDARLGAVVARAAEVALSAQPDVDPLDAELADVVNELTALRLGLDEVS